MITTTATAPIRVCDLGGWTDTWFARHGAVCNIAVSPRATATVTVTPSRSRGPSVHIEAPDLGDDGRRHPLLEAAVASVGGLDGMDVHVRVQCDAPPGASTGTSAAVTVALLAALHHVADLDVEPLQLARLAHRVETERLGLQAGVQDQIASALGGVNLIEITDYPNVAVRPIALDHDTRHQLDERLAVVFLGRGHVSSDVHLKVIDELAGDGPSSPRLERLRQCARDGAAALEAGDLDAFGDVMQENTAAQAALHPALIGSDAASVIAMARAVGATGWKVNGAGGEGGTVTVLCAPGPASRHALGEAVDATAGRFRIIPTLLEASGVRSDPREQRTAVGRGDR